MLNKKGFTLVELIVTIAIIGVLATVLGLGFSSLIRDANKSSDSATAKAITGALQSTMSDINNKTGGKQYGEDPTVLESLEASGLSSEALISKRSGYAPYFNKATKRVEFEKEGMASTDFIALLGNMSVKNLLG